MIKTKSQLLATFKKANKERREAMAKKAGYKSADVYKLFLEGNASVVGNVTKPTIHIVHVLDRSGSMGSYGNSKLAVAIQGINSEIAELKKDDSINYTFTYVAFDTTIKIPYYKRPLAVISRIQETSGNATALNQAVGETLEKLLKDVKADPDSKVLVKIFTDGGENASSGKYRTSDSVKSIIKEVEDKGFTVTFVGVKEDVAIVINNYGVKASNSLVHDNTSKGVEASFSASTSATKSYASKVLNNEDVSEGFYKSTNETF